MSPAWRTGNNVVKRQMATLQQTLFEMESILRGAGLSSMADTIRGLAETESATKFAADAGALSIWGGTGSVVDADIEDPAASRRFNELIVEFGLALEDLGFANPRTRWVSQTMEDWLNSHPLRPDR